jgi:hypothetical protein
VQRHVELRCLSEYTARRPGRIDHPESLPAREE